MEQVETPTHTLFYTGIGPNPSITIRKEIGRLPQNATIRVPMMLWPEDIKELYNIFFPQSQK